MAQLATAARSVERLEALMSTWGREAQEAAEAEDVLYEELKPKPYEADTSLRGALPLLGVLSLSFVPHLRVWSLWVAHRRARKRA